MANVYDRFASVRPVRHATRRERLRPVPRRTARRTRRDRNRIQGRRARRDVPQIAGEAAKYLSEPRNTLALFKALSLNPANVARSGINVQAVHQDIAMAQQVRSTIADNMAHAFVDHDQAAIQAARRDCSRGTGRTPIRRSPLPERKSAGACRRSTSNVRHDLRRWRRRGCGERCGRS